MTSTELRRLRKTIAQISEVWKGKAQLRQRLLCSARCCIEPADPLPPALRKFMTTSIQSILDGQKAKKD